MFKSNFAKTAQKSPPDLEEQRPSLENESAEFDANNLLDYNSQHAHFEIKLARSVLKSNSVKNITSFLVMANAREPFLFQSRMRISKLY